MKYEKIVNQSVLSEKEANKSIEEIRFERKLKLAACFRLFAHFGFDEGIAGHITARDSENPNHFWVNPFGLYFGHICMSDLIKVDENGNILEGKHSKLNKAAFAIHSQIHQSRPDINAIVHAHSIYGRIFSATGDSLKPLTIESTPFYNDHIIFDDIGGIASEIEEGQLIAKRLNKKKAAVLKNHGLLTVGNTVDSAVWWFIALERSCQVQIMTKAYGKSDELSKEEAERGYNELGNEDAGWFQFQPLFQKIIKQEPDLES